MESGGVQSRVVETARVAKWNEQCCRIDDRLRLLLIAFQLGASKLSAEGEYCGHMI